MEFTEQDKKEMTEWCKIAVDRNLAKEDVITTFKRYPKEVRRFIVLTFKQMKRKQQKQKKVKGGSEMVKINKKAKVEEEEEYEEEEEEEMEEEEEEEKTPNPPPRPRPNPSQSWFIDYQTEKFRVIDPLKKRIMLEANSAADLNLQLLVKIWQRLTERL